MALSRLQYVRVQVVLFQPFNDPEGQPSALMQADLETDDILKGRPIALARVDGHSYWVSQKILDMLGPLPEDVPGGVIRRDSQGNPTGGELLKAFNL